jgi:hypothetical protein
MTYTTIKLITGIQFTKGQAELYGAVMGFREYSNCTSDSIKCGYTIYKEFRVKIIYAPQAVSLMFP